MHDHPIDRLPALLLGGDDDPSLVEHLAWCDECAAELSALREVASALPAGLPRAAPSTRLRARLLGAVDHLERFAPRARALAELLDLDLDDARRQLHALSDDRGWHAAPVPGVTWRPLDSGWTRERTTLFARLAAGATFPRHRHVGDERLLVLDGALVEGDRVVHAGERLDRASGSIHSIHAEAAGDGCVCAVLNLGHIEVVS